MARRRSRTLTELELEIMHIVWGRDEVAVDDVRRALEESGKPLALPSIRTMLSILGKKGYVDRRRFGRGYAYHATVSEEEAKNSILKDVIDRAFDGSASSLVAALVSSGMVRRGDLVKARELARKYEKRSGK